MKKTLYPFLLAMTVAACQHGAPPVAKAVVKPPVAAATLQEVRPIQTEIAPADTLTPEMLTLLKQFDLAPLWADTVEAEGPPTLVGFFGNDHYNIAVVFDEVQRDSNEPQLFRIRGRNRYQKDIIPFEGTLRINRIADFDNCYVPAPEEDSAKVYTASATFTLRQNQREKNAGTFSGQAFLDFYITNKGDYGVPEIMMGGNVDNGTPTKGSHRLLRGIWTNAMNGQTKPFLVAKDLFVISPEIYSDFGIGDRGTQINPKYAKLGWSDYWENNEWWAKSPKPSLNL